MGNIDWLVLGASVLLIISVAVYTRRFVKSVADFVAAGRSAGRYLICNAKGEAGSGVANSLSKFQLLFVSGFVLSWWDAVSMPVLLLVAMSGFVFYRYRQTRAMTLGQFFEMRYSRRFRLVAGLMGFVAGLLNYGIFPAVGSKFFVYFMDLPEHVHAGPFSVPTYVLLMAGYLSATLWMMIVGGQVTLMVTDCIEGILSHAIYIAVIFAVFATVSWSQIRTTLLAAPHNYSLVNPFDALSTKNFNVWYALMTLVLNVYATMAWQNGHGFNSSARTPHEARMGNVLGYWRIYVRQVMLVVLAVGSLTFLRHPAFAVAAAPAQQAINHIADSQVRSQMTVPVALRYLLPTGVKGMFCAMMLLGLIAGDAAHMLSWGGIFIQDVVLPLRRTPLTPTQHIRVLRWSVAGVALFAFIFSIAFRQMQDILFWWAITMGVFTAGAGAVIIGGLYWSGGTAAGAWGALISGCVLSLAGIMGPYVDPHFPLNGTQASLVASGVATVAYVALSLLTTRGRFNLDKLLHRNAYALAEDQAAGGRTQRPWYRPSVLLGFNEDYTRMDRVVSGGILVWSICWLCIVLVGTAWNFLRPWPSGTWASFWLIAGIMLPLLIAMVTFVWFGVGGAFDLRLLFARLATAKRDAADDGTVPEADERVSVSR
jgi:SSS family solute:Na+ symporter